MRSLEAPWSAEKNNVLTWDEGRRVAANIAKLPARLKRD